jgi:hypothetical protein
MVAPKKWNGEKGGRGDRQTERERERAKYGPYLLVDKQLTRLEFLYEVAQTFGSVPTPTLTCTLSEKMRSKAVFGLLQSPVAGAPAPAVQLPPRLASLVTRRISLRHRRGISGRCTGPWQPAPAPACSEDDTASMWSTQNMAYT